jgi:hypothetical protein
MPAVVLNMQLQRALEVALHVFAERQIMTNCWVLPIGKQGVIGRLRFTVPVFEQVNPGALKNLGRVEFKFEFRADLRLVQRHTSSHSFVHAHPTAMAKARASKTGKGRKQPTESAPTALLLRFCFWSKCVVLYVNVERPLSFVIPTVAEQLRLPFYEIRLACHGLLLNVDLPVRDLDLKLEDPVYVMLQRAPSEDDRVKEDVLNTLDTYSFGTAMDLLASPVLPSLDDVLSTCV